MAGNSRVLMNREKLGRPVYSIHNFVTARETLMEGSLQLGSCFITKHTLLETADSFLRDDTSWSRIADSFYKMIHPGGD